MTLPNEEGLTALLTSLKECIESVPQVIEMDFPPADLFPNRAKGRHWASLYKTRSDYRELAYFQAKSQLKNWKHRGRPIKLDLIFEMPDKRHRDADNCLAAAKGALDGLADALFVNDRLFDPITIHRKAGSKPGKLVIKLKEHTP